MGREARRATVHRVAKSWTQLKYLSTHACTIPKLVSQTINPQLSKASEIKQKWITLGRIWGDVKASLWALKNW